MEIEKLVATGGCVNVATLMGQRGRVQDDNVKISISFLKIGESVAFEQFRSVRGKSVQLQVPLRQFERGPR